MARATGWRCTNEKSVRVGSTAILLSVTEPAATQLVLRVSKRMGTSSSMTEIQSPFF